MNNSEPGKSSVRPAGRAVESPEAGAHPGSEPSLASRRERAVAPGVATATPLFAARAAGEFIWDVEGRRYIDFANGLGALALGHQHPTVLAAIHRQLERFSHPAFEVMGYEPYIELAERLNELAPFSEPAKSILLTTGAEAVEVAVRIARVATHRQMVIAFSGAVHGRSQLGTALTAIASPYKLGVRSGDAGTVRIPFPVPHQGISVEDTVRALEASFRSDAPPGNVAAILIEPVQVEGGLHIAPARLLQELREICTEHGIMLICDEAQSTAGRSGRMFAVEHSGVEPDLIVLAKSLGGGFPLSAVIGRRDRVMDSAQPGSLGGTFAGSPLGCAAALAVLEIVSQPLFLERVRSVGSRICARVRQLAARGDLVPVANVRGLGALIGFDVVKSRESLEPDQATAKRVAARALQGGIIVLPCGGATETLRLMPPLNIADDSIDAALRILEDALALNCAPSRSLS
jgi:4-aminobutyrate aminotransferase / (S)-3-amino-2-methylpropionate transaminase / 5-aminovalerate transaminase